MNKFVKWLSFICLGLLTVALILFLFVRYYIGVNVPLGEPELAADQLETRIQVPEGFSVGVYASGIPDARMLRFTETGDLLVANPSLGKVMIIARSADGGQRAGQTRVLIDGLNGPNGLDFHAGWLYIAETDSIGRVKFDHANGVVAGDYERLINDLPAAGNHWRKTLRFGPDGLMYVALGSSCNVCIEEDERRAAIVRYAADGTGEFIVARGLRNSAGFDWSPADGALYATDNGRDLLGDDFPPCELNKVVEGAHYGWPFANADRIPDPDFGEGNEEKVKFSTPPVHHFRAHNAPLGIAFVRDNNFPEAYQGAAIVALHGSWNRREKDGYKVVSLHWDESGKVTEKDFVSGFLENGNVIGRPAEVTQGPDGAFYISDDYAGVVYRVAYGEAQNPDHMLEFEQIVEQQPRFEREQSLAAYSEEEKSALLMQGEQLFQQHACLGCHNPQIPGSAALERIGENYDLAGLVGFFAKPTPPMPVLPLSEADKEALAVYLIETFD